MKEFYVNLFAGIALGFIFVFMLFALNKGLDREYQRQQELKEYYCETYGACK